MNPPDYTTFVKKCVSDPAKTADTGIATDGEADTGRIAPEDDTASLLGRSPVPKRSPMRWLLAAILILAVTIWISKFVIYFFMYECTDDAYVAGHIHQISPQLGGQVKEVLVADNQLVKAGDVLVRLDPLQFQIALSKAQAGLLQAKSQKAEAEAAIDQAEAQVTEAEARVAQAEAQGRQTGTQLELARLNDARDEQLSQRGGLVSKADLETARGAFDSARATDDAARANLILARAEIASAEAVRASAVAQQSGEDAAVAAADAQVREAERELSQTVVVAPAAGRIGNKNVEVGDCVQAGQTLCALVETDFWVVANFKETQLAKMRCGEAVDILVDELPGQTLHGTIESMAPASGAQFALLPADNATGNFTKVVQRVPVKILFDARANCKLADYLRPGLSIIVNARRVN